MMSLCSPTCDSPPPLKILVVDGHRDLTYDLGSILESAGQQIELVRTDHHLADEGLVRVLEEIRPGGVLVAAIRKASEISDLRETLRGAGYNALLLTGCGPAPDPALLGPRSVLLLDFGFPVTRGLDVVLDLRERGAESPAVILVKARDPAPVDPPRHSSEETRHAWYSRAPLPA